MTNGVGIEGIHRAAVLGSPISHSLSPVLYAAAFHELGLRDWQFDRMECTADLLPSLVRDAGHEWAGFAVTMPGKEAAAMVADSRSERVTVLGVANTLFRAAHGWHAHNTDVDGVIGALASRRVAPTGTAIVVGGGGTARAVLAAFSELGWDGRIVVAGRRLESTAAAAEVAERLGIRIERIGMSPDEIAGVAAEAALVVSTVPAGAADHLAEALAEVPALLDVVYHPWPTALAAAAAAERVTVTGLDMLLHQAVAQFELIVGRPAPVEAMRSALADRAA